jgi:hypothetical protein
MKKAYSISNPHFGTCPTRFVTAASAKAHARRWSAAYPKCPWTVKHLKAKPGTLALWDYRRGLLVSRYKKTRSDGYTVYKG